MGMTPQQFFDAFVEQNYCDCAEHPGCVRRAFNAAVSASHLVDHYFAFYQRNQPERVAHFAKLGDFVEHVSRATDGRFRDIRSIANAYKHLYTGTDRRRAVESSVSSAGAIYAIEFMPSEALQTIQVDLSFSPAASEERVVYARRDGKLVEFLPTLQSLLDYYSQELWDIGDAA